MYVKKQNIFKKEIYIRACSAVTGLSVTYFSEAGAQSYVTGVLGATHVEIEHHLEMGRKLLAAGQLAEALSHYHSAVGKVTHRHADTHSPIFSPLS